MVGLSSGPAMSIVFSLVQNWKNFLSFVTILKINLRDQSNKEKIRDKALALLGHNLSDHGQTLY